jgi:hypothetical protein
MTDDRQPMGIEYLRRELLDRIEAEPFDDWSPALLRALIAVIDLSGIGRRLNAASGPTSSGKAPPRQDIKTCVDSDYRAIRGTTCGRVRSHNGGDVGTGRP